MKGYIVIGPESSGTRLVTEILIRSGCVGEHTHEQWFDENHLPLPEFPIVVRRSVPHGDKWPLLGEFVELFRQAGYEPHIIITMRDLYANAHSQVRQKHVSDYVSAVAHITKAINWIFDQAIFFNMQKDVNYTVFNYESIVKGKHTIDELLKIIDRPILTSEAFKELDLKDGNEKWYGIKRQLDPTYESLCEAKRIMSELLPYAKQGMHDANNHVNPGDREELEGILKDLFEEAEQFLESHKPKIREKP